MRIFSGIRASGAKTLGNYSGGFRQYAATQEQGEAFFCIVDLHSITTPFEPGELREATLDLAALLFATGLDPDRSTVFVQSHVTAHPEAAWLLSSVTAMRTSVVPAALTLRAKTARTDRCPASTATVSSGAPGRQRRRTVEGGVSRFRPRQRTKGAR